ncbi:MAG TPA: hypothetical protein VGM88_32930 [Kofleriaceae bacterium]|jgi:hypothetical protein
MADAPKLTVAELRAIVTDTMELAKGARVFDDGDLTHLSRFEHKLFADAQGSTVYKVQALAEDKGWRGRCSCMAARSRPFCKHAAALLVAWQRNPDAFAVADAPPPGSGEAKKKAVKTGKVDAKALMAKGVEQVTTLVRELAVAGAASIAEDRAAQVRALGENLREHKLRRLSAKTIALADTLDRSGDSLDTLAYADLLGDLLLTARKLEKHIGGEALEDRHVEELIGKTWTKKDRAPISGLDLVEVAFLTRQTADNFLIRESRFVDVATGAHYSEKQILPAFLAKRTPPKASYAGKLLRGAGGGLYPGYAPRRTDLESPGAASALTGEALQQLVAHAVPSVKAALAALADHRRDVFAPDSLPIAIACDMVIADRGRLQLADAEGAAVFLPDDDEAADRLATALAGVQLACVIGDLALDGALPTVAPLAVVVAGRSGLELRSIAIGLAPTSRKVRVAAAGPGRRSNWAFTARALGLSTAAIALGELREELGDLVYAGLTSVTPRRVEPLAVRLSELSLAKQADLLRATAAQPDAAARLDDLVRLHQVLGIALARLAGAAQVDRAQLAASPMFASVYVRRESELLEPAEIARRLARGELNRFEAAARTGRYYETLPPETLLARVFPTWADGSASPYIALAARQRPELALSAARDLLAVGEISRAVADSSAFQRIRRTRNPRMASITALRVLEAIGGDSARDVLRVVGNGHPDVTLRAMARAAMSRLAGMPGAPHPDVLILRGALFNAPSAQERARAADRLADAADVGALPLLRLSFSGDIASDVRESAGRALGRLGDADSVETFCAALRARGLDHDRAKTSAYALGYLGDVRGIDALASAYEAAWLPAVVSEALAAVGPAAIPALLQLVEQNPSLLKRSTATTVFESLSSESLGAAISDRLDSIATQPDFVPRASALLELAKPRPALASDLGAKILALRPELGAKGADRDSRALAKKAGARS